MLNKILSIAIVIAVFVNIAYAQYDANTAEQPQQKQDYLQDYPIDIVYNIGNIGFDFNNYGNYKGRSLSLFTFDLAGFYFQEKQTSLGLKFSPFLLVSGSDKEDMYRKISPVNLDVYWNPLWNIKEGGIFGPVVSMNYFLADKNDLAFFAGLQFSLFTKAKPGNVKYVNNYFSIRTGYRYINNKSAFSFGINFDVLETLIAVGLLASAYLNNRVDRYPIYNDDHRDEHRDRKGGQPVKIDKKQ